MSFFCVRQSVAKTVVEASQIDKLMNALAWAADSES